MKCDACKSENCIVIDRSRPGYSHGAWPYAIQCQDCGASVGCIPDTYEPLGFMASGEVRKLRRFAHAYFDDIWRAGFMSREVAKEWMREQLGLEVEFHISHIKYTMLLRCIEISKNYLEKKSAKVDIIQAKRKEAKRRQQQRDKINKRTTLHRDKRIAKRYR